ncbi:MAG: class II fructose-1,6-bisphosphate aldolase [Candidatus Gracilibacteria bacterium]|jgi:fructose-bisphosphate aldolase class II|nr:class II fructose-1,6-bisphosphate aldolase [Candidatus Gracilibacteria bacterium]
MLQDTKIMFEKALTGKYAIPAFNINNMEMIQGIMEGARLEKSPVILQVSRGARKYANPVFLKKMVEAVEEVYPEIPFALHLDHGDDFEICKDSVDGGFSSVMIDASAKPFEENIALTKQVVEYAHERGVVAEAELGKLAGVEDDVAVEDKDAKFTDPQEAKEFVDRTGCDSLAVAIGTSHGAFKFKGEPYLSFDRLQEITDLLPDFPFVLHGASTVLPDFVDLCNQYGGQIEGAKGVSEELLSEAAKMNVCKINIDTDLRLVMTGMVRKYLSKNPSEFDPRKYLGAARDEFTKMVQHKIHVCGSQQKA